ncbi:Metallopeptidase family M24 [Ceratobasidium sp. AG-Ba]|nr:Metallopeptidase family M24 [Ceratobasidium sp. AG-Ba]
MITKALSRNLCRNGHHTSLAARRPNITRLFSTEEQDPTRQISQFGSYLPVLSDNPLATGTSHIPRRQVPSHIPLPPYARPNYHANRPPPYQGSGLIKLGSDEERRARRAGALAAMTLNKAESLIRPGITSEEIDDLLHDFIISYGAYPSPLNYPSSEGPYPKSTCMSINNCLVHGIPDSRELEDGDILNIDITVYLDGFHGDTSRTFLVGSVDLQGQALVALSTVALQAGISSCRPGAHFRSIGAAIHEAVLKAEERLGFPYVISGQFTGHGIGKEFHRPPWIQHTKNEEPGRMEPGHCFTIEPVIVQGTDPTGWMLPDGWTILSERQVGLP